MMKKAEKLKNEMKDLTNYFGELEYEKYIDEHPKSELSFKEFMKDYKI